MPVLASENGRDVDRLIIWIHYLMIALFIGWFAYFIYALWRFRAKRQPKADHLGVRNHASNYVELVVAGVEFGLLIFAVQLWARSSNVTQIPDADDAVTVQVVAQQFDWNFRYPGPDGVFGRQDMQWVSTANPFGVDPNDPAGADDVQVMTEMRVPVDKPVILYISSKDVIHSFKVIALRVTQDAIPGMRIPTWFNVTDEGTYQINCAQLCGNGHYGMSRGLLIAESQENYEKWLRSKSGAVIESFE
jgi:cytochrome c oxidase subunit 2